MVSERLGHSSTTITPDVYRHLTMAMAMAMANDAAERVTALIFGGSS